MSNYHGNIGRISFAVAIASGATTGTSAVALNGLLRGYTVVAPALVGTITLTLTDSDGTVLYTKAAIPNNAGTYVYQDATNVPLAIPLSGPMTLTLTTSAAQTSAQSVTVNILFSK